MGVSAVLSATSSKVTPGSDARCQVRVRNTGAVVDQFTIEVVGDGVGWTAVEPALVNLLPDAEKIVELVFSPPRSSEVLAGDFPFAVRLRSREDPEGSLVVEGEVVVEQFTALAADLVPRSSHGRWVGKHTVAVDNVGNYPLPVDLMVADPDDRLTFRVKHRSITAIPGTATFVSVNARPKRPFWRGTDKTLPFQVDVSPAGAKAIAVNGLMLQRQILPRGLLALLSLLLALSLLLIIMLNTLLSAAPVSTARTEEDTTTTSTPGAGPSPGRPTRSPGGRGTTTPGTNPSEPGGGPGQSGGPSADRSDPVRTISIRVDAMPRTGSTPQTFSYAVPFGKSFRIAAVRLANPAGDSGVLKILRNHVALLSIALESFRSRSYRPSWHFAGGQEIVVSVDCGNSSSPCTPDVVLSGRFG